MNMNECSNFVSVGKAEVVLVTSTETWRRRRDGVHALKATALIGKGCKHERLS